MEPSTITYTNPNTGFTVTASIPPTIVAVLQWLRDNARELPTGLPFPGLDTANSTFPLRYQHEAHVIYRDVIEVLVPQWAEQFKAGQVAALQQQMEAAKAQIQAAVVAGLASLNVTEG